MEDRTQLSQNGQELQQADVNNIAFEASLADDKVFAELLRLAPYTGGTYAKAILPYSVAGIGNAATVQASTGGVIINPFRAIVGTRAIASTSAALNWKDIRSAVFFGSTTSLTYTQSLSANSSGNPRWDLVYAAVTVDGNGASNTRYIKNPSTKVVSAQTVVTTLSTSVVIGVVTGTPGATPAFPTLPSDSGGVFYIALAFVRVVNGFTGATVLTNKDVNEVIPSAIVAKTMGGNTTRPADQQNVTGGTAISGTGTSTTNGAFAWGTTSGVRAPLYLPPSMSGSESILIAIDVGNASSANWSHASLSLVDASRDWRNRLFRWHAFATTNSSGSGLPWAPNGSNIGTYTTSPLCWAPGYAGSAASAYAVGMGSSFYTTGVGPSSSINNIAGICALGAASATTPAAGANMPTNIMAASSSVILYLDGNGYIRVYVGGTPGVAVVFWLEATGPFTGW